MILNFIFRTGIIPVVIVCHCHRVTDGQIRRVVQEGACTLREVSRASRAGRTCGGCRPAVKRVIQEEIAEQPGPVTPPGAVAAS
jgi:assimilatory nitrate reductase electron transfer subunit